MLIAIQKPKEFDRLPNNCICLLSRNNGSNIAYIGLDIVNDQAGIHFHSIKWSHNGFKTLRKDWKVLVKFLFNEGVRYIIATNDDVNDDRWHKFIKLFGFPEPSLVKISKLEIK